MTMPHRPIATSPRHGFTLLELLIVVGIIILLVAVLLAVGVRAIRAQDERATRGVLFTLDRALSEYITVAGSIPKYNADAYEGVPGADNTLENYNSGRHPRRPDAAVFIKQVTGYGGVDAIIRGIPERFMVTTIVGAPGETVGGDVTPSVIDAWAKVDELWQPPYRVAEQQIIYYVHPANDLAQDLFGRCVNGRPYFMSAGPDRKYGFTSEFEDQTMADPARREAAFKAMEDNIYSYTPGPPKKDMSQR